LIVKKLPAANIFANIVARHWRPILHVPCIFRCRMLLPFCT